MLVSLTCNARACVSAFERDLHETSRCLCVTFAGSRAAVDPMKETKERMERASLVQQHTFVMAGGQNLLVSTDRPLPPAAGPSPPCSLRLVLAPPSHWPVMISEGENAFQGSKRFGCVLTRI